MGKRKYQERDLASIIAEIEAGFNVMYQLPTGGGKSVVTGEFVHHHHEKQILVLAHRRELILQLEDKLSTDKVVPGVLIGDIQRNLDSNVLIGSVQTLSRDNRLQGILNKSWDIVIVDEAHHLRTPSYDKILDHLLTLNPNLRILGLSATPYRYDKKEFTKYIQKLIISESVDSLISQGYLSKFRTFVTSIGDIDSEVEKSGEDYNATQLSQYMRKQFFLDHLVTQYKTKGESRQCLIYCVDKKHATSVEETFINAGLTSVKQIIAETPTVEREQILQDYKDGKLDIIISIGTLTEGTDLPDTGCVLVARPTESLVLFHQIGGRGMRPSTKYPDLIFLDCAGVTVKHGSLNSPRKWSLDPNQDPKEGTKRNKIVGKRKDGSYSDSLEEIESGDLEVVEMTPEEYLLHSENAIEEAKEFNKEIDKKIELKYLDLLKSLAEFVKGLSGLEQVTYRKEGVHNLQIELESLGSGYSVTFEEKNGIIYPNPNKPWNTRDPLAEMKFNVIMGKLSEKMMNEKDFCNVKSIKKEVAELQEGYVNVREIETQRRQFEIEQLELKVNKLLKESNTIHFSEEVGISGYFRDCWGGRCSYVKINHSKLLSWCHVEFYNSTGRMIHEMKALEKDRIIQILLKGKPKENEQHITTEA